MRRTVASLFAILTVATPAFAARVSAWVTPWDASSLTSLQSNTGVLDEVNPVWYSMDAGGNPVANWNADNPAWRAAMTGADIVPAVQNVVAGSFSAPVVTAILATPESRAANEDALVKLAVANVFDGVDLDYERVPAASRENFSLFVEELASKLHAAGKILSVTVYPKTSDAANWNGAGAQDWKRIGAAADSVKIMAYDYHWSSSAAGALAPLDWLDAIATYALSAMPAQKVTMSLPWYGYDWVGTTGKGIGYADATALAASRGATIERNPDGEPFFRYDDHIVYFQDAGSYSRKIDSLRAKHPTIGGFAHWRAGFEDPATWKYVVALKGVNSGGSGGTRAAADFDVVGQTSIAASRGVTSAEYSLVSLNGFAGSVSLSVVVPATFPGRVTLDRTTLSNAASTIMSIVLPSRGRALRSSASAASYQLKLVAKSGAITHERVVTIAVR